MDTVGDKLNLDENSDLLLAASAAWSHWTRLDPRLAVVDQFAGLRSWLRAADPADADLVLLALAERAATDGGDDVRAAAALAKCLLPGACRLAASLARQRHRPVSNPISGHDVVIGSTCNDLVASQLWIEVRTFPWQRLTKVAANILAATKRAVLAELGLPAYVARTDRVWASTTLVPFLEDRRTPTARTSATLAVPAPPTGSVSPVSDIAIWPHADLTPDQELADLLNWAHAHRVLTDDEIRLLLLLLETAQTTPVASARRGRGGLIGTALSADVAASLGVSEATVRRHASRAIRALTAAAVDYEAAS